MMGKLEIALSKMHDELKKEYGNEFHLEEGDEVACVFNDGLILLGIENGEIKCKVLAGEPIKIDYSLGLTE